MLLEQHESKSNEVEYLKRELQAKDRKSGELIIINVIHMTN